jgi:hypothetical protein
MRRRRAPSRAAPHSGERLQSGGKMAKTVNADQVVETASGLGKERFTRAELADGLGVKVRDLKQAIKDARQSGRLDRVGENDEGKGLFRLGAQ